MNIVRKIGLSFGVAVLLAVGSAMPSAALSAPRPLTQVAACGSGGFFGFSVWYACLPGADSGQPRLESLNDVLKIAFPVVEDLIKAAAYITAAMIIWGGFKYIKSQGDPGKTTDAKDTIRDAVIGLLICVLSVAIVDFIAGRF